MDVGKAIVVGGSIAGVSCAHALILAGWDVLVLEKTSAIPTGTPTGAGLGLDPLSQHLIATWLSHPHLLHKATFPLSIDQNEATYLEEEKIKRLLTKDEDFNFRAAHWSDLHNLLYNALPQNIFLWGHLFVSLSNFSRTNSVRVTAKVLQSGDIVQIDCNLLVAADGSLSSIRHTFLPGLTLRYSGYCAWRGVLDYSDDENLEAIEGLKKVYQDLGKCLFFDLACETHTVFYELLNKRINWIWYINQPEPELKGNSVTMKVSEEMIKKMQQEAEKIWIPELVKIIKQTKEPFLNIIYDSDPLEKIFWDNVVLIGDAAHPTTPHGLRSTNMAILDSAVLGKCLEKWGVENVSSALEEFQSIRLPVFSKQVLHARRLGRIKQGFSVIDRSPFDVKTASFQDCEELQQKNMPFFYDVPSILIDYKFNPSDS